MNFILRFLVLYLIFGLLRGIERRFGFLGAVAFIVLAVLALRGLPFLLRVGAAVL